MFKTTIAAAAAAVAFAPAAALAGPYVNVETNAGWSGADYVGSCYRSARWPGRHHWRPGLLYPRWSSDPGY